MKNQKSPQIIRVLHLDDDPFELDRVRKALEQNTLSCIFDIVSVQNKEAFDEAIKRRSEFDVVILDIHIDDDHASGVTVARMAKERMPHAVIFMCSTVDDVRTIAECLNGGADDFISKHSDKGELSLRVYNAYRLTTMKHGLGNGPAALQVKGRVPIGDTMTRVARRIPLIVDSAITSIFISGESGTGKEVVADLFASGAEASMPFVKVNCGAIAPTLLESELFGHVKGAFTGATSDKRGLFEAASGGWIFLDEVATLSRSAQVALLRVLENQEVIRVGSTKPAKIKVRVLSATNENLVEKVAKGEFRGDLWQRLRETEIELPPLRERPSEIKPLIMHFCQTMAGGPYQISQPALEVLGSASWRAGNIRELRNCLRAMTEMHADKLLTPLAIPERVWNDLGESVDDSPATEARHISSSSPREKTLAVSWDVQDPSSYDLMADKLLLEMTRSLAEVRGKLSLRGLAQMIGMSRSTLSGRLKGVVHKNIIDIHELAKLVGISDK